MHTIFFQEKTQVAENTFLYSFSRPENYSFDAGQYAVMRFLKDTLYPDNRGNARSFSFASAPYEEKLGFLMRKSESGFKKNIHALKSGDEVLLSDPLGHCRLSNIEPIAKKLVLICAGVGYSPMRSILRQIIHDKRNISCILIDSNRIPESTPELSWTESLPLKYSHIKVIHTMTDMEHVDSVWGGRRGYIDKEFLRDCIKDTSETHYCIAAGSGFIHAMKNHLLALGISDDRMCFDNFGETPS